MSAGVRIDGARDVRCRRDLSALAKLLWEELADREGGNGECWPSVARLAVDLGSSRRGIQKALRQLEEAGLIETDRAGNGRGATTRYRPKKGEQSSHVRANKVRTSDPVKGEQSAPGRANKVPEKGEQSAPQNYQVNYKERTGGSARARATQPTTPDLDSPPEPVWRLLADGYEQRTTLQLPSDGQRRRQWETSVHARARQLGRPAAHIVAEVFRAWDERESKRPSGQRRYQLRYLWSDLAELLPMHDVAAERERRAREADARYAAGIAAIEADTRARAAVSSVQWTPEERAQLSAHIESLLEDPDDEDRGERATGERPIARPTRGPAAVAPRGLSAVSEIDATAALFGGGVFRG